MAGRGVGTDTTTGAGLWVHLFLQRGPDSQFVSGGRFLFGRLRRKAWRATGKCRPKYHDFYLGHHCSLPMARVGGGQVLGPLEPLGP